MTLNKKWDITNISEDIIKKLKRQTNLPKVILEILYKRGYKNKEQISSFLNPKLENLADPFLLTDMDKATKRIIQAIDNIEKIAIFGDYDVDGITSSAVLYNFLESLGADVSVYIPNRLKEGYGLSIEAIRSILDNNTSLIITVDCGTRDNKEIQYAMENGCDIIVTDHHECENDLPKAYALINPMRETKKYPFKKLAGVGVAYKLVTAISKELKLEDAQNRYLDLVAIGTVADVVELSKENRVLVHYGLEKIRNNPSPGIQGMLNILDVDKSKVDSDIIGYVIGPRINAAGRMGNPENALNLFLTDSIIKAEEISDVLDKENTKRQEIQDEIYKKIKEKIEDDPSYENDNILCIRGNDWHLGIIGIVASVITSEYNKPCVICSLTDDVIKGSARSVRGFNIYKALKNCNEYLVNFGGHEQAAGLTMKEEDFNIFRKKINEYAKDLGDKYLEPVIYADSLIGKKDINIETVEKMKMLSPFGEGNERPIFIYNNIRITSIYGCGKENKHLKISFRDENFNIDAIGFNLGELCKEFIYSDTVDVAGYLSINEWRSVKNVQIQIIDMKRGRFNA